VGFTRRRRVPRLSTLVLALSIPNPLRSGTIASPLLKISDEPIGTGESARVGIGSAFVGGSRFAVWGVGAFLLFVVTVDLS